MEISLRFYETNLNNESEQMWCWDWHIVGMQ